jgi:hypothetical protein
VIAVLLAACGELPEPVCAIEDGTPAFPGAQGYGSTTPGGRGGRTWIVTSLADDGPGSLREAVEAEGARTIVFGVSGEIALGSELDVTEPFVTIAGQSAPGDGVVVTGAGLVVLTHDVVVRHLRIRPGLGPMRPEDNDGLSILASDQAGVEPAHHVVVDHVSLSWSEDELFSALGVHDVTVGWTLFSEALNAARHPKGPHSTGALIGFGTSCATVHHSVLAHDDFRNPLLTDVGRVDWLNNVSYDYGTLAGEVRPDVRRGEIDLVGNVWIPGPSSDPAAPQVHVYADHPVHAVIEPMHLLTAGAGRTRIWADENLGPHPPTLWGGFPIGPVAPEVVADAPFDAPPVDLVDPDDLVDALLPTVGASAPSRDAVDERVLADVVDRTGSLLDDPADVGGVDVPAPSPPRADADGDALPDDWEVAHGLDPTDPADALSDPDGDGIPMLEDWLDELAR